MTVSFDDILAYPYWRHRIDLRDGNVTPGVTPPTDWDRLQLPDEMDGRSFLDIGCFDGLHAFEAERRGSEDVLATDIWEPGGAEEWWYGRLPRQDGLDLVREYMDSIVQGQRTNVYDLSPETTGTFDVVLCSKVLPFVPDPYGALDRLVSVTDDVVVVESASPATDFASDKPALELAGEVTENDNRWWHPTPAALEAMLLEAGCTDVEIDRVPNSVSSDDIEDRRVTTETTVYSAPPLEEEVDTLDANQQVSVLYEHQRGVRVQYRHHPSEAFRQGWVPEAAIGEIQPSDSARNLTSRAFEYYEDHGPRALLSEGINTVRDELLGVENQNLLAKGYVR